MTGLRSLDEANRKALELLRDPGSDAPDLLLQLLTTSCLLELRRLLTSGMDASSFVVAAVDTLTRLAPLDRCAIVLELPGLAPLAYGVGDEASDAEHAVRAELHLDGTSVGALVAASVPPAVERSQLLDHAAHEISSGLSALAQREQLRRNAAEATVLSLAAELDERYDADSLQALARAIASLPGVAGVSVSMANERFGGPVEIDEGTAAELGSTETLRFTVDRRVDVAVTLRWLAAPGEADHERARLVLHTVMQGIERIEAALRLAAEAEVDELTRVGNRRAAQKALKAAHDWTRRNDDRFSVLLFDLDRFKNVNDSLGHPVGDAVLLAFAQMLAASTRAYDQVARWGGEEFLVVLPGVDHDQAISIAERLRVQTPEACAGVLPEGWQQTVSVGVATLPDHADEPSRLVRAADDALYRAKGNGRDAVGSSELRLARTAG